MADVEMVDAGAAPKVKSSKAGVSDAMDGKKRFEVKKVSYNHAEMYARTGSGVLTATSVERCGTMGMGHCGRQLCHLPQPHYGLVHRLPSQSVICYLGRVHSGLGYLQRKRIVWGMVHDHGADMLVVARIPFPLHFPLAQDPSGLPTRQS